MLTVEWSKYAKADLLAILDYISDDDPAAAWRLKEEIDSRIAHLPTHPRLYKAGRETGDERNGGSAKLSGDLCRNVTSHHHTSCLARGSMVAASTRYLNARPACIHRPAV